MIRLQAQWRQGWERVGSKCHKQWQLLLKDSDLPHSHCKGKSSQTAQLQREPLTRETGSWDWAHCSLAQPRRAGWEQTLLPHPDSWSGLWSSKEQLSYQWIFKVHQVPFLRIQAEPAHLKGLLLLQGNGRSSLKTKSQRGVWPIRGRSWTA